MKTDYARQVRRFGGVQPYVDEDGRRTNISHAVEFLSQDVKTDDAGNIIDMPLLTRKPCFGRPERFVRGALELGRPYGDMDSYGKQLRSETRCDRCPVFAACMDVACERIESCASVSKRFHDWFDATEAADVQGKILGPYRGKPGKLWNRFLDAIVDHGGWTSVNDANVALYQQEKAKKDRAKANATRKAARTRQKALRKGTGKAITKNFLVALQSERDRRAAELQRSRVSTAAPHWLKKMSVEGCERLCDVWHVTELLKRAGKKLTGENVAKIMIAQGNNYGLSQASLRTRVLQDRRERIAKLEDDRGGAPLWDRWVYDEP